MAEIAGEVLVPPPPSGRVFSGSRRVRFGDVNPAGRIRLDALSEYIQDLASDDIDEGRLAPGLVWVVRRAVFEVRSAPRFLDELTLHTWCSGLGRHWAERRVSMRGAPGARDRRDRVAEVDAAVLWVALDRATNRPARIPDDYLRQVGEAAQGREVSARLRHEPEMPDGPTVSRRPWRLRAVDFDLLGHVNNAAAWAMVEEVLGDLDRRCAFRAEMEFRVAVEPGASLELVVDRQSPDAFSLWAIGHPAGAADDAPVLFTTVRVDPLVPTDPDDGAN